MTDPITNLLKKARDETPTQGQDRRDLGPASTTRKQIEALFKAGADIFRLNLSHGTHEDHKARYDIIRQIEEDLDRPIGVLVDLQGPKLRVGIFKDGGVELKVGQAFRLDPRHQEARRPDPRAAAGIRKSCRRCGPVPIFSSTTASSGWW